MSRRVTFAVSKGVRLLLLGAWVLTVPALAAGESKLAQAVPCQGGKPSAVNLSAADESASGGAVRAILQFSCLQLQPLTHEPSSGANPVITDMSFPRRVVEVAGMATWFLHFSDRDRDVNWVRFEEFNGGGWMDAGNFSPPDALQNVGKIKVVTKCMNVTMSLVRAWLYDRAEHRSEPYYYVLHCQMPFGVPAQANNPAGGKPNLYEGSLDAPVFFPQEAKRPDHVLTQYRSDSIEFVLNGLEAQASQLQVFDLAGGIIFTGSWVTSVRPRWNLLDNQGQPVPNGVYLYVIAARGFDEHVRQIGPRKLVILR